MDITAKAYLQKSFPYEKFKDELHDILRGYKKASSITFEPYNWEERVCQSVALPDVKYFMNNIDFHNKMIRYDSRIWVFIYSTLYVKPEYREYWLSLAYGFTPSDFDDDGILLKSSYDKMIADMDRQMSTKVVLSERYPSTNATKSNDDPHPIDFIQKMKAIKDGEKG